MDLHTIRHELHTRTVYDIPLGVTCYARVSSESDGQLNSLGNQISYCEDLIRKNKTWTLVPSYIDEGLSGISTKRRENFNRMIDDAGADKFDLVITKGDLPFRPQHPGLHPVHPPAVEFRRGRVFPERQHQHL